MKKILTRNKLYMFSLVLVIIFVIVGLYTTIKNNQYLEEYDAITILFYSLMNGKGLEFISLLAPVIVFIVSTYQFHKNLKTGNIKYRLTRENYKTFMKKSVFKSYAYSTILVVSMILLFICCCFVNSDFDFSNAIPQPTGDYIMGEPVYIGTAAMINLDFYNTPVFLMFTFFIVIFLHSIFYANIGLIMCKRNKSFVISVVSSFLIFMGICIVFGMIEKYIVISYSISSLKGVFNLLGIWVYSDINNLINLLIVSVLLVFVSSICLFFTYKNKESVIIYAEK